MVFQKTNIAQSNVMQNVALLMDESIKIQDLSLVGLKPGRPNNMLEQQRFTQQQGVSSQALLPKLKHATRRQRFNFG